MTVTFINILKMCVSHMYVNYNIYKFSLVVADVFGVAGTIAVVIVAEVFEVAGTIAVIVL